MTSGALATANADFAIMNALQAYHDSVNSGTDPATAMMLATTAEIGLATTGITIQTSWVSVISGALATAQAQFASDPAT